jgi:hypothetical protein
MPRNDSPFYFFVEKLGLTLLQTGERQSISAVTFMVAGACNHPNCLVLPFRLELIPVAA